MAGRHGSIPLFLSAAAFLAFAEAFGIASAPLPKRVLYWAVLLLSGALLATAVRAGLGRLHAVSARPRVFLAAQAVVLAAPMTIVVAAATELFFGDRHGYPNVTQYFLPVLVISAVVVAWRSVVVERDRSGGAAAVPEPFARFHARLPHGLQGADIYAVEAEDHYLRVHTSAGSALILMRMADAVEELAGLGGARTHRSWWVARDAVIGSQASFGRATLRLKGGLVARVSRTYARQLKRDGWY